MFIVMITLLTLLITSCIIGLGSDHSLGSAGSLGNPNNPNNPDNPDKPLAASVTL